MVSPPFESTWFACLVLSIARAGLRSSLLYVFISKITVTWFSLLGSQLEKKATE